MKTKTIVLFFLLHLINTGAGAAGEKTKSKSQNIAPPFITENDSWVDSVYQSLTVDEKLGQLFMVAAYSNKDSNHVKEIASLVADYHIGGLIFMQGGPVRQAKLTNYYQSLSVTPLMISIDGEWGLSMRLDSTMSFPKQMALGAIKNDSLIYLMGQEIARQCKRIGVTINFAPDIDINNNAANPVIGMRSFGENKDNVARKGIMYMQGLQSERVFTTGKHFPGHGDTDVDSHLGLPVVNHPRQRLDTLEMYPFKKLIEKGLAGMMVAHMQVNSIDKRKNTPTTLSRPTITSLLRKDLGFNGLIFTDALNMRGVSSLYKPGEVDLLALKAGNDVLLFAENVPVAIARIKSAMASGEIDSNEVFEHCRKILMAKKWMHLDRCEPVRIEGIEQDLHTTSAQVLNRRLVEASITVVKNQKQFLPIKRIDTLRIASLNIGDTREVNRFQERLGDYAKVTHFRLGKNAPDSVIEATIKKLQRFNLVIVSINGTNIHATKQYGITDKMTRVVSRLSKVNNVVLAIFASPYSIKYFTDIGAVKAIVLGYEDKELPLDYTAQAIFGGIAANGTLPVTVPQRYKIGTSEGWQKPTRLRYTIPEDVGMHSDSLKCIDEIVEFGIGMGAFPGCQVLVAKNNSVVFNKSFGYHTYQKIREVNDTDLFDIASVTKVVASAPSLMKLSDHGVLSVDDPLCVYLPGLDSSNKAQLKLSDMLAHQAGLRSWIPFYLSLIEGYDKPSSKVWSARRSERYGVNSGVNAVWLDNDYKLSDVALCNVRDSTYTIEVASNLFLNKAWYDTLYMRINDSRVSMRKDYLYSDLGYFYYQKIIENRTGMSLDTFVMKSFYNPLGAYRSGYLPLNRFNINGIVPTEIDAIFRKQLLQGYVHDPAAAMIGGVAGHAGVFSNANDLAKIMQMYLNEGTYGGERYLSQGVVNKFTGCAFCPSNHRGLAFDKQNAKQASGPVCRCAPMSSYGHTGFTGTMVWVDPDNNLVFVFLSNRVHPDAENSKINKLEIRRAVQQTIYNSIEMVF